MKLLLASVLFGKLVHSFVHPIEIHGKFFVDSVTREPFYIKGVDYQPGGSSAVSQHADPLSVPEVCARDIQLFQELGVNTIRVYSVNPDLNHDVCMTLLASAGIYLVLDVNSPLENQHLNRYEPWTTYNSFYMEHVFKVVDQFSGYNNTLGFFAGNEIVNDPSSAAVSPPFIKAVIRDIKLYLEKNSPRKIPVGYSAADDLHYRISLSKYLECVDDVPQSSLDFYGVNSYQWCGVQNMQTSGYDILVNDYEDYTKPVFLSEFGCNEVTPRIFDEISSLYSTDMFSVFAGGLVYEFTQEPNNYGLVKVRQNGDVQLLSDFMALKSQYSGNAIPSGREVATALTTSKKKNRVGNLKAPECEVEYKNLDITKPVAENIATAMIERGVRVKRGEYIILSQSQLLSPFKIFGVDGNEYPVNGQVQIQVALNEVSSLEAIKMAQLQRNNGMS